MSSDGGPGPGLFVRSEAANPSGRFRRRIVTVVIVAAVILSVVAVLWFDGGGSGTACENNVRGLGSQSQSLVVAPCNTAVTVAADGNVVYNLPRVSDAMNLWGEITSNATLSGYLVNSSDLLTLNALPPGAPATKFQWASGNESAITVQNLGIPGSPTQYFFVVQDLHPFTVSADWSDTLMITYTSTFTQ